MLLITSPTGKLKKRGAFTLPEAILSLLIAGIVIAFILGGARTLARNRDQWACLNHMRQLGVKVLRWSTENNGNLLPVNHRITPWGTKANHTTWMMILHDAGYFPLNWQNMERSELRCPSREDLPRLTVNFDQRMGGHYGMNPYPGFDARLPLMETPYKKLSQIARPSRTMMLGEVQYAYQIPSDPASRVHLYPHPAQPEGMNLVFMDGHAVYWKGKLPDPSTSEDPYPWY